MHGRDVATQVVNSLHIMHSAVLHDIGKSRPTLGDHEREVGNSWWTASSRSSKPSGAMFQPMSVYGPSCRTNSTQSAAGHEVPAAGLCPSTLDFSLKPSHGRTAVVE